MQGVIRYFDDAKGFGFIGYEGAPTDPSTGKPKDVFFHMSARKDTSWMPRKGDSVTFEMGEDDRGRGPKAVDVAPAGSSSDEGDMGGSYNDEMDN